MVTEKLCNYNVQHSRKKWKVKKTKLKEIFL